MTTEFDTGPDDPFYAAYRRFKEYATPSLKPKHARRFDRDVWLPGGFAPGMSVLEIGCGTGLFLAYLATKGLTDIAGVDHDPALRDVVPAAVRDRLAVVDLNDYLAQAQLAGRRFDRIAMFDVLEHFTPYAGLDLLAAVAAVLAPAGRVVLKVPNVASPWGASYQYGDLTHRTAFTPGSLRQLAQAAGFRVLACYPHREGSPVRQMLDRAFHGLLGKLVATPPEIWAANMYAVLAPAR